MQGIYAINFFAGVGLAGGFAGTSALSLLALIEVSTETVIYACMGSLVSSCELPHPGISIAGERESPWTALYLPERSGEYLAPSSLSLCCHWPADGNHYRSAPRSL